MANLKKVTNVKTHENTENTQPAQIEQNTTFNFLAGYLDKEGKVHKEFELREMTGRDEENLRKAETSKNPSKAIRELLCDCILRIGDFDHSNTSKEKFAEIVKDLLVFDQDYALMQLRRISMGEEIELKHTCPECKTELETTLTLEDLELREFDGDRKFKFSLPRGYRDKEGNIHTEGTMRLPNGLDRELLTPIAKINQAKGETSLLARICKFDDGTYITDEVMRDMVIKDREYLSRLLTEHNFGYNLQIDITCDRCGTTFKGSFNQSNFI